MGLFKKHKNINMEEEEKRALEELRRREEEGELTEAMTNSPLAGMYQQGDMKEVIKVYTDNDSVPKKTGKKFWGLVDKNIVLGFNDQEAAKDYLDNFEKSKLWDIMRSPAEDYTWEEAQEFVQLQNNITARINRSILRPNGGINERIAENMQIQQHISSSMNSGGAGGVGTFNRFQNFINRVMK